MRTKEESRAIARAVAEKWWNERKLSANWTPEDERELANLIMGAISNPEYEKAKDMPLMFAPDVKEWGEAFEALGHSEEPVVAGPSLTLYRCLREENQRLRNAIELLRPKQENYVDFENFDTAAEQWNAALEKAGVEHP